MVDEANLRSTVFRKVREKCFIDLSRKVLTGVSLAVLRLPARDMRAAVLGGEDGGVVIAHVRAIELGGVPAHGDHVEVLDFQPRLAKAKIHGQAGEGVQRVFLSRKPLFLGEPDNDTVHKQGRRRIRAFEQ